MGRNSDFTASSGHEIGAPNARTIVVFFFEADVGFDPSQAAAGWRAGPLPVFGQTATAELSLPVRRAVVGLRGEVRRWHIDLDQRPRQIGEGWVIGVEALGLRGLEDRTCVVLMHVVLPANSSAFRLREPLDISSLDLPSLLGGRVTLSDEWLGGPIQRPLTDPPAVAELVCAPDSPEYLPEPPLRVGASLPWNEYQYRMYSLTREDPEPGPEEIQQDIDRIQPIGGGTLLVGAFRSVAEGDFGNEVRLRTFVVSALLFGVAQAVLLNRLSKVAAELADPTSKPRTALALSRGVTGYRAVHAWSPLGRPELDSKITAQYRERTRLDVLERELSSFETGAQAAISAETNVLLALIAILAFAGGVAAAVVQAAGLQGWSALWGLLVAVLVATAILVFPTGRSLRAAVVSRRTSPLARRNGD